MSEASDGARFVMLTGDWAPDGIAVIPFVEYPGGVRAGDVVVSAGNVSLEAWARNALNREFPRPAWHAGDVVDYTVRRGVETVAIRQQLGRFPLGTAVRAGWVSTAINLTFLGLALFLFIKKPDETVARVLLLISVAQLTTNWDWGIQVTDIVSGDALVHHLLSSTIVFMLIWMGFLHLALAFPRPMPWLQDREWVVYLIYTVPYIVIALWWWLNWQASDTALGWLRGAQVPVFMVAGLYSLLTLCAIIYTYATVRDPVGRAQIRWVLFAVVVAFLIAAIVGILPQFSTGTFLFGIEASINLISASFLLVPISIIIAVLRYRLFDIDVIVRRTTSYALLTGLLAAVYFGSVVLLQRVFVPFTGESDVAVVLSTLLIAALFLPLRRRVQDIIDRRFFRKKYDAEQVLNRFAATARDETDLDALTAELVRVIQETMQPEQVSVWLKPLSRDRSPSADPS
jgi:hypothetical protein